MARVSFRLRRVDALQGSYLRYDDVLHGARADQDSGLRADGLQVAPTLLVSSPFISATSSCYGEVDLEWRVPIVPMYALDGSDNADITDADVVPTSAVLVYSPDGNPETISSGTILVDSSSSFSFRHRPEPDGLPEGKWAYYSLFIRYQSRDGDDYYEKVAHIQELVVRNYGSTEELWNRIPSYYREQDTLIGTEAPSCLGFDNYGSPVGPLLKFIAIFGFEMDRTRTLYDYLDVAKDPDVAERESLDALAVETGSYLRVQDLGMIRLRGLLSNIGLFRRIKGTARGAEFLMSILSGGGAEVDTSTRTIKLFAQRVNHILDPKGTASVADHSDTRDAEVGEGVTDLAFTAVPSPVDSDRTLYQNDSPVDVVAGDTMSFSVHSGTGPYIQWARLWDVDEDEVVAHSSSPVYRGGVPYFDMEVPAGHAPATVIVEYMVDESTVAFSNRKLLLEKNHAGPYFDGDEVKGGWLVDSTSISDFRWEGGVVDNARSLYDDDYQRTIKVLELLLDEVIPIDIAASYSISFNNIP